MWRVASWPISWRCSTGPVSETVSGTLQAPFDILPEGIALVFDLGQPFGAQLTKATSRGTLPRRYASANASW